MEEAFEVVGEMDGNRGLAHVAEFSPTIILVSNDMLIQDGIELLSLIRRLTNAPIMVIGADGYKGVVTALLDGADMYLKKPFNLHELVSRVHALLRRVEPLFDGRYSELNHASAANLVPSSIRPFLTDTEAWLFTCLMEKYGRVVRHEELMMKVWGRPVKIERLRFFVHRLRKKLANVMQVSLRTRNGVGYLLGPIDIACIKERLPND
ncbi:MAG: response regulator transcription factor [Chloroflexi bacterium]|nr:response regulator transcription factor [Chloroflexota bacterium]